MGQAQRRKFLTVAGLLLAAPLASLAQQQGKVWRIGVLETTSKTANSASFDALRSGLRELGYLEGRNLIIHYRSVDGHPERFRELAYELVLEKVDLIVTRGTPATLAAMAATTTTPIVITAAGSPVRSGLVKSLAHPGGNVTGLSALTADLSGKRLQLLKEILPSLARVGVLANMSNPNSKIIWQQFESAARSLRIEAELLDVRKAEDFQPLFEEAKKKHLNALVLAPDSVTQAYGQIIAELSKKYRLPLLGSSMDSSAGALLYYAANIQKQYFGAATYIDKIFKGAKPGDLPMEEPAMLELTINLKTAKALGVTIPRIVLQRADKVIE